MMLNILQTKIAFADLVKASRCINLIKDLDFGENQILLLKFSQLYLFLGGWIELDVRKQEV